MKIFGRLTVILVLVALTACETPESVAKFCASAVVTLNSGDELFDDMQASCIRQAQTAETFGTFSATTPDLPECTGIGKQAAGIKSASHLIAAYFQAIDNLASFGSSKTGDNAATILKATTAQAKMTPAQQPALAAIAAFLTHVATEGYQQNQLASDLVKAHEDIAAVLTGLGEAAGVLYLQQLRFEEQKTAARYKDFLLQQKNAPDVALTLDARWQADRAAFAAKQQSAECYQSALATLAKANDDLAAHARSLKSKDLTGLLSPYAAQLDALVPAIQKAFLK